MGKLVLDPVTRIEGHLRIDTEVKNGAVSDSWSKGEMFRGFESLLSGRHFLDAPTITQRICGVCPISHAIASSQAIESALGLALPHNGKLLRNLILGANFLQSHILHFYQLSALDFIHLEDVLNYRGDNPMLVELRQWAERELANNRVMPLAPLRPHSAGDYPKGDRWNMLALKHYLDALEVRQQTHKMAAIFGGKMPHAASLVPGGVTSGADWSMVENYRSRLQKVKQFVLQSYLPDVIQMVSLFPDYLRIGRGCGQFLSYGAFEEASGRWLPAGVVTKNGFARFDPADIREEVVASYYSPSGPTHPTQGECAPQPDKAGAYSWIKAPRYAGHPCEVGPLARLFVAIAAGEQAVAGRVEKILRQARVELPQLDSVLGRHLARAIESVLLVERMEKWLDEIRLGESSVVALGSAEAHGSGNGVGFVEAPRGSLGHWIGIDSGRISHYQCVVPSTWTFSPRDEKGQRGPVEQALLGTPVNEAYRGLEVARVVRSFDPCIACAIH